MIYTQILEFPAVLSFRFKKKTKKKHDNHQKCSIINVQVNETNIISGLDFHYNFFFNKFKPQD